MKTKGKKEGQYLTHANKYIDLLQSTQEKDIAETKKWKGLQILLYFPQLYSFAIYGNVMEHIKVVIAYNLMHYRKLN